MGRTPSGNAPIQSIQLIRGKHLEIMRRLIAGESQRRIALELGMSEGRLSVICNSPLFKRKYAELEAEVKSRFVEKTASITAKVNELQPHAVNVLENILKNKVVDDQRVSLSLKRDVALDVLDLGGNGKKSKESNTKEDAMSAVVKIISDGFNLAKAAMEERSRRDEVVDPGAIIDVGETYGEITDDNAPVETTPVSIDESTDEIKKEETELDRAFAKAI
jgi:hypothetical protein